MEGTPRGWVLRLEDVAVEYRSRTRRFAIVEGVALELGRGEIVGLAGESGSGKSTLAEAVVRLLDPPRHLSAGRAWLWPRARDGARDLFALTDSQMRQWRWRHLAYIPQGAMNSLNPVMRVRAQLLDGMRAHGLTEHEARARVPELLRSVGLDPGVAHAYPHQLSGGMRQRVVIAAAISLRPEVLIADEITTAVDVHVQRTILETLDRVRRETGVSVLLVSHDMGVHAELADRVAVMYCGQVVEAGPCRAVLKTARHPYVRGLVGSIPSLRRPRERLAGIPGGTASPGAWPSGCRFHPRCSQALPACRVAAPVFAEIEGGQGTACHLYEPCRGAGYPAAEGAAGRPPDPARAVADPAG